MGGVSLWSYGKGFAAAERKYLEAMNEALAEQAEQLRAQTAMAVAKERKKHEIHQRVQIIERVSCDLPPECVQWTDNIMRAAHSK
jgi:polyhydroxyalkanoate synthesis regulator protein